MPIEGIDELINELQKLSDDKTVEKIQKKALKPVAEEIYKDMVQEAPVSKDRNVHGVDLLDVIGFNRKNGRYEVGLTNQVGKNNWEIARGIYFQNYTTNAKHFGWFDNWIKNNKKDYEKKAKESVIEALKDEIKYLK